MTYRDDGEAAQARIEALERELAETRRHLEDAQEALALTAAQNTLALQSSTRGGRWLGAPQTFHFSKSWSGNLDPDGLAFLSLVEVIRTIAGERGDTKIMPFSMLWTNSTQDNAFGPRLAISVIAKSGQVTLTVDIRMGNLIYRNFSAGLGAAISPAMFLVVMATPLVGATLAAGVMGGAFVLCRSLTRRAGQRCAALGQRLFDALRAEMKWHLGAELPD